MSFRDNLVKARGHLVFLAALGCGLGLISYLDGVSSEMAGGGSGARVLAAFDSVEVLPIAKPVASTPEDLAYARIAWTYFQNNTNAVTGLVNSVDGYASTTMWETGSYFNAVISAQKLGIIDRAEAVARISKAMGSLQKLRLFDGILPNKAYNVKTLELVDYANKPSEKGLGWSALDLGRVVSSLAIVQHNLPELAPQVSDLMARWSLSKVAQGGQLIGGNVKEGVTREDQEGRVGYEQYVAKSMMLFGYDMSKAYHVEDHLMVKQVEDQPIAVDNRLHRGSTPAFTVSEPYLFDGLEFGFDARSHKFATAIYKAQEGRYRSMGALTAVTEGHVDQAPYFVYASVWGGGEAWSVMSFKGDRFDSLRFVSTKVAFGWDALFRTEYSGKLMAAIAPLGDTARGWPEGIYETGGKTNGSVTANTNAIVLAALAFRAQGPLLLMGK